jgi:ribosomal-protein-alanine N-acetyltransferase
MDFDASKLKIVPLDESKLASIIQIAETLEEAPHWPLGSYADLIRKTSSVRRIALVALYDSSEEVAGFVIASVIPPDAELESIGVTGAFQRHGVGARLMRDLMTDLYQSAIGKLLLEVRSSNSTALAFYRSIGFIQTGIRRSYYTDPAEDAMLMELRLK